MISGNSVTNCNNSGSGTKYVIRINDVTCDQNTIVGNLVLGNDVSPGISDAGTGTYAASNNDS